MEFMQELFKDTKDFIDIREVGETKADTRQYFFNLEELGAYDPPLDKNIYYGVFGRVGRNGTAKGCNTTKVLWCDYDEGMKDLTVSERIEEVGQRLRAAELPEPSILVSSGNGIHSYWLLSKRASNSIVEVNRAIARATNGDIKATDKARILRVPGTRNVKDKNNPLKCEILQADYSKTYDLSDFKEVLEDNIGDVKQKPLQANPEPTNEFLDNINVDRPCISGILKGVPGGERNFALGRLTKWLQVKGYTKEKAKQIIIKWNMLNDPPEEQSKLLNDFMQYWKGDYLLLGCSFKNPELQQLLYKYCNRPECKFSMAIGNIKLENSIPYNNRLINDLSKVSGNDLIVYGLLVRHTEGLTTSLLIEKLTARATGKTCMSNGTRIKSLDTLRKNGFVEIKKGIQNRRIENLYKAIPQGNYGLGFTLTSNGAINGAIDKRITPGELKLYVLLLRYAFNKGSCYPSLNTMAKELRTTSSNISHLLNRLEKNDYIKRQYKSFDGVEKLDIRLLV